MECPASAMIYATTKIQVSLTTVSIKTELEITFYYYCVMLKSVHVGARGLTLGFDNMI